MAIIVEIAAPAVRTKRAELLPADLSPAERRQRAGLVSDRSFIDTANLSTAEMLLTIRTQRALMVSQYYQGTPRGQRAMQEYLTGVDVLNRGLHNGFRGFTGFFSGEEAGVYSAIRAAPALKGPASGFFTWEQKKRDPARGIGDPVVPIRDCQDLYPVYPIPPGQNAVTWVPFQQDRQDACILENKYRRLFNEHLESTSQHPLYLHMGPGEANGAGSTGTVAAKRLGHAQYLEFMAIDSRIPKGLIREWMANGIMRMNVAQDGEPWNAQETIAILKENGEVHKVGIDGFSLAIAAIVVAGLIAAAKSAKSFIEVIKGDKDIFTAFKDNFELAIDFIGSVDWGADAPDWVKAIPTTGGGQEGNNNSNNNPLPCPPGSYLDENGTCTADSGTTIGKYFLIGGGIIIGGFALLNNKRQPRPN